MALVIGSSLLLRPEFFVAMGNMGFLSPDDAIANGDQIKALIRTTGSNHDGRTQGITMPSAKAQESLIRHLYRNAALDFTSTRYFEAHGTGTPTGDPIEISAIGKALISGSVKSNIGHLGGGSGLAGLLKTFLVLERGAIPLVAMFKEINPAIDLKSNHLKRGYGEPFLVDDTQETTVNGSMYHLNGDTTTHFELSGSSKFTMNGDQALHVNVSMNGKPKINGEPKTNDEQG
ncbi:Compactin diketide synthase mlcB [Paramyrothecium foliicola]|nr:Compactin diketide synthase mlcB [Paramyrothecium foliicola]